MTIEYKNKYLLEILRIVKSNDSLDVLLSSGLEYSQIVNYIQLAIEQKLISSDENFQLTKNGEDKIIELQESLSHQKKNLNIKKYPNLIYIYQAKN